MFSTVKCNSFSQVWILDNNFMNIISLWICGEETNLYFGNKGRTASLLLEDNVTCIHNVFYKNCKNSIVLVCYSSIYMSLICKRVAKYVMCVDVMAYIMHGGWAGRSRSLRELQCGSWVTELWALCRTNPSITFPISLSPVHLLSLYLLLFPLSFSPYRCSQKQVKPLQLSALATIHSTAQTTARTSTSLEAPPPLRPTLSSRYPSRPFPLPRLFLLLKPPRQLRRLPARRSQLRKTRSKTRGSTIKAAEICRQDLSVSPQKNMVWLKNQQSLDLMFFSVRFSFVCFRFTYLHLLYFELHYSILLNKPQKSSISFSVAETKNDWTRDVFRFLKLFLWQITLSCKKHY